MDEANLLGKRERTKIEITIWEAKAKLIATNKKLVQENF